MKNPRTRKALMAIPALAAATLVTLSTVTPASADVTSTGRYRACFDNVAVRVKDDGPAIDNLKKHQTFVVESGVGNNYVFGFKLVNGVHGKVKASSLDKNC
jgi:hypothetical protein